MFDRGSGPPLIVIPGVQGRWEWMRPALDALQSRCRTISYSLSGELGSDSRLDPELGFDNYVRQLDAVFERTGLARAALCGVSYGGFVGVRYAALRPDRVSALVLVSSIGAHDPSSATGPMRPYLEAKAEADAYVTASGLDYTIVRPGSLTDDPGTGLVTVHRDPGHRGPVPRDDVAAVLAACLNTPATVGVTFELFRGSTPIPEALAF